MRLSHKQDLYIK